MNGRVSFVGAGPGDPELLTVKGQRLLAAADVVLYDSLVDVRLLEHTSAEQVYVGKRCGRHSLPQEQINGLLVTLARRGKHVVRLKGGDPAVLGRVGEEALALAEHGIPYEIVPGVTSAIAAPAYAGIPVTHRGLADSFVVATAHKRDDALSLSIPPYNERTTLILLMPIHTARTWQQHLLAQGYPQSLPVAFVIAGGCPEQRVVTSTVGELEQVLSQLASPTMAVIGRVVTLRTALAWYEPKATSKAPLTLAAV